MLVADCLTEFLIQKGVRHVFGYQGGAVARIIHSIVENNAIEYIQNYHEQASSFAASGYAKTNGKVGVALATSGPGAINLIAGIADSYCDSVPCLFITGQDHSANISNKNGARLNGFQDIDIVSVVKPITKYAKLILHENELLHSLEKAFYLAKSGRPGPVLIDIPVDIQLKMLNLDDYKKINFQSNEEAFEIGKSKKVISLIKKSQKPLILCGGGVKSSEAKRELFELVKKLEIPVVTTSNAIDVYSKSIGFSGLNGNTPANMAILNSDLILVLGARLGQQQVGKLTDKYTKAQIIHIDIDKLELGRVFEKSFQIYSDLKIFLAKLNNDLIKEVSLPDFTGWGLEIEGYNENYGNDAKCNKDTNLDPVIFIEKLSEILDDNAIITLDVGQNQMWSSQGIKLKGNQKLISGVGYGSMGCSLPYAIGSSYASSNNDNQIISINGDGGFQMNMQELMLISQKNLNIKIIVFNNSGLGLIKATQDKYMDGKYYGTDDEYCKCVNLELLAKAYDIDFLKIDSLDAGLNISSFIYNNKPCIIELKILPNAKLLTK